MTVTVADSACETVADRCARLSRRQEAARAPTAASRERPRRPRRDPWSSPNPARKKKIFYPRPAAQGRHRHVTALANRGSSRGSPAAPGASAGSVVPRGPRAPARQPLRPRDRSGACLRHGLRSARLRGLPQAAGSASRLRSRAACRESTFWARPAPASRPRSGSSALRSGASALAFSGSCSPSRVVPGQPAGAYPQAAAARSPPDTACPNTRRGIPIAADAPASPPGAAYTITHQHPARAALSPLARGSAPRP